MNNKLTKQQNNKVEMDKCVICGKDTIYPKDLHIDYRLYYIEGAGQLCVDCYEINYNQIPRA